MRDFEARGLFSSSQEPHDEERLNLYSGMRNQLEAGKGGFDAAEKMALFMQGQGAVSVNCYGGKDRTGYLLASITFQHLFKRLQSAGSLSANEKILNEGKLAQQLISDDGVAKAIIEENTKTKAIKILPADLRLYMGREDTIQFMVGCASRLRDYGAAAMSFMVAHEPAKFGELE